MPLSRRLMALTLAGALLGAAPASAEVTLINLFEVPPGKVNEAVTAWETARDFLSREPGYIATTLHQAIMPDARFALVNVARWESTEAFRRATERMNAANVFPAIEGLQFHPGLYRVIRADAASKGSARE